MCSSPLLFLMGTDIKGVILIFFILVLLGALIFYGSRAILMRVLVNTPLRTITAICRALAMVLSPVVLALIAYLMFVHAMRSAERVNIEENSLTTPDEEGASRIESDAPDWNNFETIFEYADEDSNQKLGVKKLSDDSISFRLLTTKDLCETEFWGNAVNRYADGDAETDEDEEGEAYPVDEFVMEDSLDIIAIRIGAEFDKARVKFTGKSGEEGDCFPMIGALMKRDSSNHD